MQLYLAPEALNAAVKERQLRAAQRNRAAALVAARKWERKAASASRRARAARTAVR